MNGSIKTNWLVCILITKKKSTCKHGLELPPWIKDMQKVSVDHTHTHTYKQLVQQLSVSDPFDLYLYNNAPVPKRLHQVESFLN